MDIKYRPVKAEVPHVAEAIRLMTYVVRDQSPDPRWMVGYVEGVAYAQAFTDFWCEDAEDGELWKQCARMHGAGPQTDTKAAFRRARAWFEYIRTAAEWIVEDPRVVV